jgi:hypothetical protein
MLTLSYPQTPASPRDPKRPPRPVFPALMAFDAERDLVTFCANGPKGQLAEFRDMMAGRPHAPVAARENAHARQNAKMPCG